MLDKRELFNELHTNHYPMVHQMCMGFMKGSKDLSNDLAQETFINIWSSLENFKGNSTYKTWIYRITMNTCLKYIRDNKIEDQINIDQHTVLAEPESLDEETENVRQQLYQAIGQLNEVDRFIIMMILDEMEYEDIADVVGITEGNLRVKIHRIKKKLRSVLQNG